MNTKITLQLLQSLLGRLNFACRSVSVDTCNCRSQKTCGIMYNVKTLSMPEPVTKAELHLLTDAAGSVGYGVECRLVARRLAYHKFEGQSSCFGIAPNSGGSGDLGSLLS